MTDEKVTRTAWDDDTVFYIIWVGSSVYANYIEKLLCIFTTLAKAEELIFIHELGNDAKSAPMSWREIRATFDIEFKGIVLNARFADDGPAEVDVLFFDGTDEE